MRLSARIATLELAETFVISRSAQDTADVVYVELEHEGVTGYGEATPIAHYGQSAESALAYLEAQADALGDDPWALEEIESQLPSEEPAARAAIDAALHDLQGKLTGRPVWRLLGLRRAGPPTSWTIWLGDPDDMATRTEAVADRFKRLKLKLGGRDGLDVERSRRWPSSRSSASSTASSRFRLATRTARRSRRARRSRSSSTRTATRQPTSLPASSGLTA
jgi:L-alanine-DL-glutamate epimerase-like enolase superfamily enzyme